MSSSLKYISSKEAQDLDDDLMNKEGFTSEQLMELAGLSASMCINKVFPVKDHTKVLVVCGPGNNGGDGLIVARHLSMFGYKPTLYYPKPTQRPPFIGLVKQCLCMGVPFLEQAPSASDISSNYQLVVDSIFGFSFSGDVRSPFDTIIKALNESKVPIASIDVPSGWDIEKGNAGGKGIENPTLLLSLTAPKICASKFVGKFHYLGGRFIPPSIAVKYSLNLPPFPGSDQFVQL